MRYNFLFFLIVLILFTIITYLPTFSNGFTNWDDLLQVTENPDIKAFTINNIKTIFSSFYIGMYQPLTTLCFSIEYAIFGLNATGFHSVSLLFHIINIVLIFWLLTLFIKRKSFAFLATALFAVHPMCVEAVAWVSARSTLMSASFFLGALISYISYLKSLKKRHLLVTFALFLLALFAKATAITLPIILILLDVHFNRKLLSKKVILEKIPFLLLAFVFGIVAINGRNLENVGFSFIDKLVIMCYQILWYLVKFISPLNLSSYYPNPKKIDSLLPSIYYVTPILVFIIGYVIFKFKKYFKTISLGLLFFMINVSLTLKLFQVGKQLVTDRYTYIPYVGFCLVLGILIKQILIKKPKLTVIFMSLVMSVILVFSYLSNKRIKVWQNSRTLWTDVVKKNANIPLAQTNLGVTYVGINNIKAEKHFLKSIELDSTNVIPYNNIGYLNLEKKPHKAEKYLFKAIEKDSTYLFIYTNLASLYMKTDKLKAKINILKAQKIAPKNKYVLERVNSWNKQWLKN